MHFIGKVLYNVSRIYNRAYGKCLSLCIGHCGKNVVLHKPALCSNPRNLYMNDNTSIMKNWTLISDTGKFIMKDNSIAAPNLTVITGNHNRLVDHTLEDCIANRLADVERDVVVGEEVWLGTNVTLLPGVHIGRGTTVAAGSVVTHDLPPYSLCAGVPAKVKKVYWSLEQIIQHEECIYPVEKRLSKQDLQKLFETL